MELQKPLNVRFLRNKFLWLLGFCVIPGIRLGTSLIYIFALIQLPKGANIVFPGNLRGSVELNWLMWLAISTVSLYEIFGAWLMAIPFGFGLYGLWIVQGIDGFTRFMLNL